MIKNNGAATADADIHFYGWSLDEMTPAREEIVRQRLRAAKTAHEKAMREAGWVAGCEFILATEEEDGVYVQVMALARHCEHNDAPKDFGGLIEAMDFLGDCENPDGGGPPMQRINLTLTVDCLRDRYGRATEDSAWVAGFVSGALEKFRELAP